MTESFLYLVDLKPLTIIILPLSLLTVPRPSVFTASSSFSCSRFTGELRWWTQARPTGHVRQCSR